MTKLQTAYNEAKRARGTSYANLASEALRKAFAEASAEERATVPDATALVVAGAIPTATVKAFADKALTEALTASNATDVDSLVGRVMVVEATIGKAKDGTATIASATHHLAPAPKATASNGDATEIDINAVTLKVAAGMPVPARELRSALVALALQNASKS